MKPSCPKHTLEPAKIPRWIVNHARLSLYKHMRTGSIYDALVADVLNALRPGACVRMEFETVYDAASAPDTMTCREVDDASDFLSHHNRRVNILE